MAEEKKIAGPLSDELAHKTFKVDGIYQDFNRIKIAADAETAQAMITAWKAKQRKEETGLEWKVILKVYKHPSGKAVIYGKGSGKDMKKVVLVKPRTNKASHVNVFESSPGSPHNIFTVMTEHGERGELQHDETTEGKFDTEADAVAFAKKIAKGRKINYYLVSNRGSTKNNAGYKAESRGFTIKIDKDAWSKMTNKEQSEMHLQLQGAYVNPADWGDDFIVGIVEGDVPKTEAEFEAIIKKQVAKLAPKYRKLVKSIHIDE